QREKESSRPLVQLLEDPVHLLQRRRVIRPNHPEFWFLNRENGVLQQLFLANEKREYCRQSSKLFEDRGLSSSPLLPEANVRCNIFTPIALIDCVLKYGTRCSLKQPSWRSLLFGVKFRRPRSDNDPLFLKTALPSV